MKELVFRKEDQVRKINTEKDSVFYWAPTTRSFIKKDFAFASVFIATFIFIFPNILLRLWMANDHWKREAKKLLNSGWKADEESQIFLAQQHIAFNEQPADDGKIWMTNGIVMEEVQVLTKLGFWKTMKDTMIIFFQVEMYWMSFVWILSNITGVGDFFFTGALLASFPVWRTRQLRKKGFKPLSEYDAKAIERYTTAKRKNKRR